MGSQATASGSTGGGRAEELDPDSWLWSVVDLLASEYGWTKDYILFEVYPVEYIQLMPHLADRKRQDFIDKLQIAIMTDSMVDEKDRAQSLNALDQMRRGDPEAGPPEREFDRSRFEELRKRMGAKKGKAPKRV